MRVQTPETETLKEWKSDSGSKLTVLEMIVYLTSKTLDKYDQWEFRPFQALKWKLLRFRKQRKKSFSGVEEGFCNLSTFTESWVYSRHGYKDTSRKFWGRIAFCIFNLSLSPSFWPKPDIYPPKKVSSRIAFIAVPHSSFYVSGGGTAVCLILSRQDCHTQISSQTKFPPISPQNHQFPQNSWV